MSAYVAPVTAITVAQFRALLPEFADSSVYLDELVLPWLVIATAQISAARWGAMLNLGIAFFTAHQLVLSRQATLLARRGGIPGTGTGIVSNKSVNGVSVGYDVKAGTSEKAGDWNLTSYGVRFINWARMFGSGGDIVLGGGGAIIVNESWPGFGGWD